MACMDHIGNETVFIAECQRGHNPVLPGIPKRKLKSTSSPTSSQAEQSEEPSEMHKHGSKRGRNVAKSAKSAVNTPSVPTKGLFFVYLFMVNYQLIT